MATETLDVQDDYGNENGTDQRTERNEEDSSLVLSHAWLCLAGAVVWQTTLVLRMATISGI